MSNQRLIIYLAPLVVALIGVGVFLTHQQALSAKLTLEVSPASSTINLSGLAKSAGSYKVRPGSYRVAFSHSGFSPVTQTVVLAKGQSRYIGEVLTSDSPNTTDWYKTHTSDQILAQSISGKNLDQSSKDQLSRLPLIKELPFVDQLYRVDYGASKASPNDPSAVALYIKYYSATGKQQALDWLKFKGYDPAKLEIIYTNASGQ